METIGLIYPNGTTVETSFEVAERILCRQLRMKIADDKCIKLPSTYTYEIQEGDSCCGGKGKLVIKKVSISKSKTAKK